MNPDAPPHVAYVVKRYPRFSETFIVNEILAHEAAGTRVTIFSLRAGTDTHFQDVVSRVKAPVHYLPHGHLRAEEFWRTLQKTMLRLPGASRVLEETPTPAASPEPVSGLVHQAMVLALEVQARGIQHLHAHFATSATAVAALAARLAGIGYTFTAHAKDIFHEDVDEDDLRRKLTGARAVVTVSDFNVEDLRRRFGADAGGVRRIYNGLDLSEFAFHPGSGVPGRIVAAGRLVEKKGFDVLVDACALLRERGVPFECRIVGSGEEEEALRAQIAGLGLQEQVRMTGPLPRAGVIQEMRGAGVFAAPCVEGADGNRDGLPTVLLEAMALGVPCVSTRITGIPELVEDGITGVLLEPGDRVGLADALQRLLPAPPEAAGLVGRARRRIEADFDIHRNADQLREIFFGRAGELDVHAA